MEDNKYYYPDISEFHVNFEYEYRQDIYNKWEEVACDLICDDLSTIRENIKNELIRVKYLDQEDIESLEFNKIDKDIYEKRIGTWRGLDNQWLYIGVRRTLLITVGKESDFLNSKPVFTGYVKNKSELKKVLTMIQNDKKD